MPRAALAVALAVWATACHPARPGATFPGIPAPRDAPYELSDDGDLLEVRDHYDGLVTSDAARPAERDRLAQAYAARIDRTIGGARRDLAHAALLDLVSLWSAPELADEAAAAAALAPWRARAQAVRDAFAHAGGAREAATALLVLAAADPARRAEHLTELDELLAYTDDLAVSQHGDGAERSRSIEILREIGWRFPAPVVLDRLIPMLRDRQRAVDTRLHQGSDVFDLVRAHGKSVLRTAATLVAVLASAGRIADSPAALDGVTGIGDDQRLRRKLDAALAVGAGAGDWVELAEHFRSGRDGEEDEADGARGALAVCLAGLVRFPDNAALLTACADDAAETGRIHLGIRLAETALVRTPDSFAATNILAQLYHLRLAALVMGGRGAAARQRLEELEAFHRRAAVRFPGQTLGAGMADAWAAMGRGLARLGEVDEAERYLRRSLATAPGLDALDTLASLLYRRDRFADAAALVRQAMAIRDTSLDGEFARARVLRTGGDALAALGDGRRAEQTWRAALAVWGGLRDHEDLDPHMAGERLLEAGKVLWALNNQTGALVALDAAVDSDPDGADTLLGVIAFLLVRSEPDRALDAYHRALGSAAISDAHKVYASLWVVAEARRSGRQPDSLARDFLAARNGPLWYDDMARLASGRARPEEIAPRATSRGRRADLMFYAAVFGDGSRRRRNDLLEGVVETDTVMVYEYERARQWLAGR